MKSNTTKNMTIDSYEVWLQELKQMVDAAERAGISREWSEDYIIAHLPAIFGKGGTNELLRRLP